LIIQEEKDKAKGDGSARYFVTTGKEGGHEMENALTLYWNQDHQGCHWEKRGVFHEIFYTVSRKGLKSHSCLRARKSECNRAALRLRRVLFPIPTAVYSRNVQEKGRFGPLEGQKGPGQNRALHLLKVHELVRRWLKEGLTTGSHKKEFVRKTLEAHGEGGLSALFSRQDRPGTPRQE